MDIFLKLPSEYLRGIVFLSDRTNYLEANHKIRLEYLTKLIEDKLGVENSDYENENNTCFQIFKKKLINATKDALINVFLQYLSALFPEFNIESISFCKTGVLEVRSQTLKLWRERFIKFHFHSKIIEIFKDKNNYNRSFKYSFNLGGYVIRWIDKEKCLISLNSINYQNRYKTFLFMSKNMEILKDWYETLKFALSPEKFYEFEGFQNKIENFKVMEHFQDPKNLDDDMNDLSFKKRYHSKSSHSQTSLPNHNPLDKSNNSNENLIDQNLCWTSPTKAHDNLTASYTEPYGNQDEIRISELKENYLKKQNSSAFSEEPSEFEEYNSPEKINNINQEKFKNSLYSSSNVLQFERLAENFDMEKMNSENNYELISYTNNIKIIQNILNPNKFKLFLTLPYFFPLISTFFLDPNLIKKWDENLLEYKILSIICQEKNLSIVFEERKNVNLLYFKRHLTYQRFVQFKNNNSTLICCKSIKHPYPSRKLSIKANLNFSILSIIKLDYQTKISFFIDLDNKGMLTKHQNFMMIMVFLNMFQNIRKIIENIFVMGISSINDKNIKPLIKIRDLTKNDNLEENVLKKRKSFPTILHSEILEEEKKKNDDPKEKVLKNILQDIKENIHVKNCIQKYKYQQKGKEYLIMDKYDFLFVQSFWNILESGKFEYLDTDIVKKQNNILIAYLRDNMFLKDLKFPLDVLEPVSELEKIAYLFSFAPLLFKDLSEFDKPIDQMKIVIIFIFSFLFLSLSQKIPFISILGETFQSKIGDFYIYAEKISNDPNTSFILIMNEYVRIESKFQLNFQKKDNIIKMKNNGFIQIIFKKTQTKFYAILPSIVIEGISEVSRVLYYESSLIVYEIENSLFSEILFANPEKKIYFKKKIEKFNEFYGNIYVVSSNFIKMIIEKKNWEMELKNEKLKNECRIEGSLSSSIEFDKKIYWSFDKHYPYYLKNIENPLPSDSKFRKDIIFFKLGITSKAEMEENILKNIEDNNKKLRENRKKIFYKEKNFIH